VLIGGVPYLLVATGFLLWTRGASEERVRRGVLVAPLVYAGALVVCLTLFLLVDGTAMNSSDSLGMFALFALLFGYAYVGLAKLGRLLLRPSAAPANPAPAVQDDWGCRTPQARIAADSRLLLVRIPIRQRCAARGTGLFRKSPGAGGCTRRTSTPAKPPAR
jgi:hypothetical protein